jgi:hypothetical protein
VLVAGQWWSRGRMLAMTSESFGTTTLSQFGNKYVLLGSGWS